MTAATDIELRLTQKQADLLYEIIRNEEEGALDDLSDAHMNGADDPDWIANARSYHDAIQQLATLVSEAK